nr:hypothetical protein HK105_002252 [Polyrhizophydium stewartii]
MSSTTVVEDPSPLNIFTISLGVEYAAFTLTVMGMILSPAFFVWAVVRYQRRPSGYIVGLSFCVLGALSVQIFRIAAAYAGDNSKTKILHTVSVNVYYDVSLLYSLIQLSIMSIFLLQHQRHWAVRLKIFLTVVFCVCCPAVLLDGIVFDSTTDKGFWTLVIHSPAAAVLPHNSVLTANPLHAMDPTPQWLEFAYLYLLILVLIDCAQSVLAIAYLSRVVITIYTKNYDHKGLTDSVRRGIRRNQLLLSAIIVGLVALELAVMSMVLFVDPGNVDAYTLLRIKSSYRQFGFTLSLLHTMGGTFILERMRDFKKMAEGYHILALSQASNGGLEPSRNLWHRITDGITGRRSRRFSESHPAQDPAPGSHAVSHSRYEPSRPARPVTSSIMPNKSAANQD